MDLQVEDDSLQIGGGVEVAQVDLDIYIGVGGEGDADGGGVGGEVGGVDAGYVEGLIADTDSTTQWQQC